MDIEDSELTEFADMIAGNIYTRNWEIIGTDPPSILNGSNEHLIMLFREYIELDYDQLDNIYDNRTTKNISSIILNPVDSESIEILPVSPYSLCQYYNYFASCVIQRNTDKLITICRRKKKSPCFDIEDCYLVIPASTANLSNFITVNVNGLTCVPLIPQYIIENMRESLAYINIIMTPNRHDCYKYNGARIRLSKAYTTCEIEPSEWKGNTYTSLFNKIIKCEAVATATFTVSMILGDVYGSSSVYMDKKSLTIVIHAIK